MKKDTFLTKEMPPLKEKDAFLNKSARIIEYPYSSQKAANILQYSVF